MKLLRSPSLFVTFAGSFLAVLIIATIIQAVIIFAVVEPIALGWMEERTVTLTRETALEVGRVLEARPDADIKEILRKRSAASPFVILLFQGIDGRIITSHDDPPQLRDRFPGILEGRIRDDGDSSSMRPFPPPDFAKDHRRSRILARYPVDTASGRLGDIVALPSLRPPGPMGLATPSRLILYLPLAILIAGLAGLLMFRIFVRRLHELETLAAKITEGDLEARIPDPGADEIGRLGSRFNKMTESLAEARRNVEESDRQRRRLLADISHELATPLTSIRGYAETLLNTSVSLSPAERVDYLEDVLEEARRMDFLIQDLLELTRLEAGAIPLTMERLDWISLCRNTIERFLPRFKAEGLNLHWTGSLDEAWITADGRRLEQLLENLLINTLRYVPSGGLVNISIQQPPENHSSHYRLVVEDNGPGFPPEDLNHVFDRFYQGDPARASGGSGLGLAIVKEITLRHGGSIRAENSKNSGAVIIVDLPVTASINKLV
ncbi:MAG: HAMP domain-containing protein [Candidatus Eisenbacteria bacterium]|uniref:histidine kinase n=1 Tax=Eiseniibacteriota bacterium TaxID=2212470 RepID=A0A948W5S3_UNCEI|nr:HAMP domain-containing protein [Candidatus Eisenbacteria bacterium]MBU1948283.1 HAMP domain-containing protein [Candidatus Eisenbacteria bacterium]MBU2689861.1 HAMP domain-containing protein [Candidatus Eisenbacteria bacterium]